MMQLKRLIKADIMKLKSTHIFWMHLYVPLIGLLVFLGYYSYTPWNSYSKVLSYFKVLAMIFPILIGIITSIVADQEDIAQNFQNILIGSKIKCLGIISKYILLLLLGLLSTILAVIGFYIGFSFIEKGVFSFTVYLSIIGILVGSNIIEYILHLFLSMRFSKEISIGVGIVESLISALFRTGMGDGRWPFFPSAWGIRFIDSFLLRYESANNYIDPSLNLGISMAFIGTSIGFIGVLIWFTKWEGNRIEE